MEKFPIIPQTGTSLHQNASIDTAYALVWSVVLAVGVRMKKGESSKTRKSVEKLAQIHDIEGKPRDIAD